MFSEQLKDWVRQVLFLVSCSKGQVEKYVNVEACIIDMIEEKKTLPYLPINENKKGQSIMDNPETPWKLQA